MFCKKKDKGEESTKKLIEEHEVIMHGKVDDQLVELKERQKLFEERLNKLEERCNCNT